MIQSERLRLEIDALPGVQMNDLFNKNQPHVKKVLSVSDVFGDERYNLLLATRCCFRTGARTCREKT